MSEQESIECLRDVVIEAGQSNRGQPRPGQRNGLSGQQRVQDVVQVKFAAGRKELEVELKSHLNSLTTAIGQIHIHRTFPN